MASAIFPRPVRPQKEDKILQGPLAASEQEESSSTSSDDHRHARLNLSDGPISKSKPDSHDENVCLYLHYVPYDAVLICYLERCGLQGGVGRPKRYQFRSTG
jgi:hypothetical protein